MPGRRRSPAGSATGSATEEGRVVLTGAERVDNLVQRGVGRLDVLRWSRCARQEAFRVTNAASTFWGSCNRAIESAAASTLVFWPSWMMIRDSCPWAMGAGGGKGWRNAVAIVRAESLVIVQVLFRKPPGRGIRAVPMASKELIPIRGEESIGRLASGNWPVFPRPMCGLRDDVPTAFPFIVWGTSPRWSGFSGRPGGRLPPADYVHLHVLRGGNVSHLARPLTPAMRPAGTKHLESFEFRKRSSARATML